MPKPTTEEIDFAMRAGIVAINIISQDGPIMSDEHSRIIAFKAGLYAARQELKDLRAEVKETRDLLDLSNSTMISVVNLIESVAKKNPGCLGKTKYYYYSAPAIENLNIAIKDVEDYLEKEHGAH